MHVVTCLYVAYILRSGGKKKSHSLAFRPTVQPTVRPFVEPHICSYRTSKAAREPWNIDARPPGVSFTLFLHVSLYMTCIVRASACRLKEVVLS